MKLILGMIVVMFVTMGASCSVKEEVKGLQTLKTECENLQLELESLGATKWTKTIDDKVKTCKDHGFWEKPKRKPFNSDL